MKNIEFKNSETKKLYQALIREHKAISGIMLSLLKACVPLRVAMVTNYEYGIDMIVEREDEAINIYTDFLKKKIYVDNLNDDRMYIYDDYPTKSISPSGYLYQNNERAIIETLKYRLSNEDDVKYYQLKENGTTYSIIINIKDVPLSQETFIKKLLYNCNQYYNIRDLFVTIVEILGTNHFDIKIGDSKGSNITITDGKVDTYIEYYEEKDQYIKIYLENGQFYYERKVKEPYEDNMTSYVKKIGERDGKKER